VVAAHLDEHDNRACKAATIADCLDLEPDAVSAILSRLKGRGLVRHKRP
jgi:Mn-dependent DtxR family transcriptional regulator